MKNLTPPINQPLLPAVPTPNPTRNINNIVTATPPCPTPTPSGRIVQGQGPGTGNIPPTPTPSTSTPVPITTDDVILINALSTNQYSLTINYVSATDTRLTGVFTVTSGQLVLSYPTTITINQQGVVQNTPVASFETSGSTAGNYSDGTFTSINRWGTALPSLTNSNDYTVDFVVTVTTPAGKYYFTFAKGILPVNCPAVGYKANDIISVNDLDDILGNFCCKCYPDGTGNQIVTFQGVQCKQVGSNC